MSPPQRRVLRVFLVALLAGSVALQVVLPALAEQVGGGYTETAGLVVPYAVAAIVAIACLQVGLGAGWWLLGQEHAGALVAPRSVRGVDVAIVGVAAATVLAAAPPAHLLVVVGVGGPGVLLALVACVAAGVGLTAVLRSLRADLRAAVRDGAEYAGARPS